MNSAIKYVVLLSLALLLSGFAYADLGPKPSMQIRIIQANDADFNIIDGWVLTCADTSDGNAPHGLVVVSPRDFEKFLSAHQKLEGLKTRARYVDDRCVWVYTQFTWGHCYGNSCRFWYHIPDKFRVALLVDKNQIIITPPVDRKNFYSMLEVTLYPDGTAEIRDVTPVTQQSWFRGAMIALTITEIIELIYVLIWWRRYGPTGASIRRLIAIVAEINILTVPTLWYLMYHLPGGILEKVTILEIAVILIEYAAIYHGTKHKIGRGSALWLSLGMNLASITLGSLLEFLVILMFAIPI